MGILDKEYIRQFITNNEKIVKDKKVFEPVNYTHLKHPNNYPA